MTTQTAEGLSPQLKSEKKRGVDSLWRRSLQRFMRHRGAVVGLLFLALLLLCAIAPHLLAAYDPLAIDMNVRLKPPSLAHPFGTDDFGRDILSRLIYGVRISLQVGFVAVTISTLF